MPEIKSIEQLSLILGFLVPGLVAMYVRAQFLTGRMQGQNDAILTYLSLSVVWWGIILPFTPLSVDAKQNLQVAPFIWLVLVFFGPAVFGALIGLNASWDWSRRLFAFIGIDLVHVIPTAWDWKFGKSMPASWVLLTLKDGTHFAGYCGEQSFASSDPSERDLYLEKVYEIDDNNNWILQDGASLLITQGEIQTIEFWPDNKGP